MHIVVYKTQNISTANFINRESGSTICMNFILIGSNTTENQTHLLLLFEGGTFGQNMAPEADVISCGYHGNDTSAIQIWLFLFIIQGNLPPHKN